MTGDIQTLHRHVGIDLDPLGDAIHRFHTLSRYHYGCERDGSLNVYGRKMNLDDYLGKYPISYDYRQLMFISFPYELLDIETNYRWFKFSSHTDLLTSNINILSYLNN